MHGRAQVPWLAIQACQDSFPCKQPLRWTCSSRRLDGLCSPLNSRRTKQGSVGKVEQREKLGWIVDGGALGFLSGSSGASFIFQT